MELLRRRTAIDERRIEMEEKHLEVQQQQTQALFDAIEALSERK